MLTSKEIQDGLRLRGMDVPMKTIYNVLHYRKVGRRKSGERDTSKLFDITIDEMVEYLGRRGVKPYRPEDADSSLKGESTTTLLNIIERQGRQIQQLANWNELQRELAREASVVAGKVPDLLPNVPDASEGGESFCEYFLSLSDWHVGDGYAYELGRYNEVMLRDMLASLLDKVRACILDAPMEVRALNVMLLGDMVQGDGIYPTQHTTMLYPAHRQVAITANYLSRLLQELSSLVPLVRVFAVRGNHGRTGNKYSSVHPNSNWDMATYLWTQDRTSELSNVEWRIGEGTEHLMVKLHDVYVILSHGDHIKINNRVPYYGLEDYMRSTAEWFGSQPYSQRLIFVGHLHIPFPIQSENATLYCNGALQGFTSYVKNGRFTPQSRIQFLSCWAWGLERHPIELSNQKIWLGRGIETDSIEEIE